LTGEVLARPRGVAVVRGSAAVVSGALPAAAFPGTGSQGWLAFGALIPLLVATDGAPWRVAAALGGAAGLTFWVATIPWIAPTVARYGHLSWVLAWAVFLALAGYLAFYWAVVCAVLSRFRLRSGPLNTIFAGSLWVALEYLRTFLFTGFPWNLLGDSQYENRLVSRIPAVTGVYGVSSVVVAVNAALAPSGASITFAAVGQRAQIRGYYEGTDSVALKRLRGDLELLLRDGGSHP
jgi:apolipoprotein N-acyltransferase